MSVTFNLKKSLESRKARQGLYAPDKIKNTLFTLCSCIREIRAFMLKTNQVTGKRSCISCTLAIHGDKQEIAPAFPSYMLSMAINRKLLLHFLHTRHPWR
jgi:hypothetical protein